MTKTALLRTVKEVLAELDLRERVAKVLPQAPIRVRVVAIGKAAPAMAQGALDAWNKAIEGVLVIAPDGLDADALEKDRRVILLRAAHPLPDEQSVHAAETALAFAAAAERRSTLPVVRRSPRALPASRAALIPPMILILISGGASALVCAPVAGVSLATKRAVTSAMLRSGATVREINIVRKHLSRIKGGGLARAAATHPIFTLVASDVIGGTATDVGSGPSVGDPSTVPHARRLLARFAPKYADLPLARTPSEAHGRSVIVASPEELAKLVAKKLDARLLRPSTASVEALAAEYLELVKKLPRGAVVVRAAEPSVHVTKTKGRGGRSCHLAALVGRALPDDAQFLALATDGVDGSSGTGGAFVERGFATDGAITDALARFDTGRLHRRAKTALPERATGHNLADLHVLVRG